MKQQLASLFRHAVTGAAGIGGFLVAHGLLDTADAVQVSADTVQAVELLSGVVATVASRYLLGLAGKVPFLRLLGWSKSHASALLLVCTAAALLSLPSCATTVASDGTRTTKADPPVISQVSSFVLEFARVFLPAPKAEPVPSRPPEIVTDSGK